MRLKVDILARQFEYVKSSINNKGQMVDNKLGSPLEFQYHYASFVLASVLLGDNECLGKVMEHYIGISKEKMKPSNDFNVFLLLLAISNDDHGLLNKYKNIILNSTYHVTDDELYKLNNNFRALRLVGLVLEDRIKESSDNAKKIVAEIDWLLNLQFEDGFFPDSNMNYGYEKNNGVPHLVYHAKITMCLGIVYSYIQESRIIKAFNKAVDVLLDISVDEYYFFYGRSTNAIFGYSSLYVALILSYKFSGNEKCLELSENILNYLKGFQYSDGHISINLNRDDRKRLGFDSYMYELVYNSYSNAMFLYANRISKKSGNLYSIESNGINPRVTIYNNSGFVTYRDENVQYCFNYKGHQNSIKHRFDSRVSPFSLLYFKRGEENILPALAYKPRGISHLVEGRFYFKNLRAKLYQLFHYDWLPIFGGNSFFYIKDGVRFYPFRCIKTLRLRDTLIMKFESKARGLFYKKELKDQFVISIDISSEPKYKVIFYSQVDSIFYSYREIYGKKSFEYTFSKEREKLSSLRVETSCQMGLLHRCKFTGLKTLEIKVKVSD
ncbi:hypothetical protein H2O73_10630 [Vibrio sp. 404]|uniref:Heparin-sulfate lyase N-terminal domain-containing protein n=1 Tax=Vibrio marinisediminis TaxID=2758441 RepID=A0A7W2FRB1_9VIBR|nr:hypothetical protein [Vibrio marinisediminis]MBA5762800.1 hypothetical protein [Vibrio marinisediminis]